MRPLGLRVMVLLATVVTYLAVPKADGQSSDIAKTLKNFPGYHILTLAERNSDARRFIQAHFSKLNPSIVYADVDGDGHRDYAMLLKDNKSQTAKLVFLLCSKNIQCKNVEEVDVTPSSGEIFIRPVDRIKGFPDRRDRDQALSGSRET